MKSFFAYFAAAFIALVVFNFVTSHVQKVDGPSLIQCLQQPCFEINNTAFIIK